MNRKTELLKETAKIMQTPKISQWYKTNLEGKDQYDTINSLELAIQTSELSVKEALSICLIVGVQWAVNFEMHACKTLKLENR